ncbi:MAG: hypothetical protein CVT95_05525 [Bacteroidetes bacterium HGW-Bacteroidetes-12]|nr:MAG: hypothetical protein CVT95_05525 [Bacteroidetes bacterium HGW-Bacteroidetes-12]
MSKKIYEEIQAKIVQRLEDAKASNWVKPWLPVFDNALNPASNSVYKGFNQIYLSIMKDEKAYKANKWVTFKQAKELGATVLKGAKGTPIIYFQFIYKNEKDETIKESEAIKFTISTGKSLAELGIKKIGFVRFYFVFNVAQVEGLPNDFYTPNVVFNDDFNGLEIADTILTNSKANIHYILFDNAYYDRIKDEIVLPYKNQFLSAEHFYNTAFHELSHWSGAPHRLNRKKGNLFADKDYAFEELIAEFSAALICGSIGIQKDFTNNAAYLDSWLKAFKNDIQVFFKAAATAQKAADFILEFAEIEKLELVA